MYLKKSCDIARCVVSCCSTSFPWLVFFFGALLWGSMIHKHTGRWMWQGSASVISWNWDKYSVISNWFGQAFFSLSFSLHKNLKYGSKMTHDIGTVQSKGKQHTAKVKNWDWKKKREKGRAEIRHKKFIGAPNFLSFKGVPSPLPRFFRGYFHPLFINLEGITACSKVLNFNKTWV